MTFGGTDSLEWFTRFGNIPGIAYAPSSNVNRARLRGADSQPTIIASYSGFPPRLRWGSGSASPAHERAFTDMRELGTAELLQNLNEALELPGRLIDYHFAMQLTLETLWSRRHDKPGLCDEIERIAWLDINLVLCRSEYFRIEGEARYLSIRAFGFLRLLYEREGALQEALQVAQLAGRYAENDKVVADLQKRVSAEAEA